MNVLDSIEHFCVDMLEFPEYIPSEAQVLKFDVCKGIGSDSENVRLQPLFSYYCFWDTCTHSL